MLHSIIAGKRVPSHELSLSCEGARKAQADLTLQVLGSKNGNSNISISLSSPELAKGHIVQVTINGKLYSNADTLSRTPCEQCGCPSHEYTDELIAATIISAHEDHKLQLQDPILGEIIGCKQTNSRPHPRQDLESRRLMQLYDQLVLKQDLLYCTLPSVSSSGLQDKLVVPKALRAEILKELHEGSLGGHLGNDKTLWKLKERFYWPGHYKDVQKMV